MATSIFASFGSIFGNVVSWLNSILAKTGMFGIVVGCFFIVLVVRFLIYPLLGGNVKGDSAKSSSSSKEDQV